MKKIDTNEIWNEKDTLKVAISALIFSVLFNIYQIYHNSVLQNQYKDQLMPEIQLTYKYDAVGNHEKRSLHIQNVGSIPCTGFWIKENVYLIINDEVFEGLDVPHIHYITYNGSRNEMYNLEINESKEIELEDYQIIAFQELREKFKADILVKWECSFHDRKSKRYSYNQYFIYNFDTRNFEDLITLTGGTKYINYLNDYLNLSSKNEIRIFQFTENFEKNPPNVFYIDDKDNIMPLNEYSTLTFDEINSVKCFYPGNMEL
ncbi:hypothetical protein HQ585_18510 [candidate division KSB1 bacterium]|nr:hypothetical protein [candidate division KSB1 bacterium]